MSRMRISRASFLTFRFDWMILNAHFLSTLQCRHFRKHYIAFAQQVNDILEEYHQHNGASTDAAPLVAKNPTKTSLRSFPTLDNTTNAAERSPQRVKFYAVSCTANQKLCHQQGVHAFPKIKLYPANTTGNATSQIIYYKLHAFDVLDQLQMVRSGMDSLVSAVAAADRPNDAETSSESLSSKVSTLRRTKQQVFDDAHLSFVFTLRNSVFTSEDEPLTNATKVALRKWLELVHVATPVLWAVRSLIQALLADFDTLTLKEEAFLAVVDRFPTPTQKWSASCKKGVDGMGYTCGLWQLFHIISVGLVEYNLVIPASDDEVLSELAISTPDAAETIRNFVEYFFACDECKRHFLQDYDACAGDRCSRLTADEREYEQWILFPVWLFETHNAVNARLLKERSQREHRTLSHAIQVESQWPSVRACPKCWFNHGGWDEENVYKYLRTEYWYDCSHRWI
jgi:Erv1 / Alr family